ncbi:hypothetical protein MKX08_003101 [Trichoderma sp. CBMAI-0020]|nr:hypothetical protein MKX08_003101 [Trichoderma sp. CBMAI-0020]
MDDRLVISVDFGTTYSGIAYCFADQRNNSPIPIDNWPGANGIDVPKIPTVICYDKKNPQKFVWGGSVEPQADSISGFKLLLDPSQPRPEYVPGINIVKEIQQLPKTPIQITADFIGAIHNHAIEEITKKFPKEYVQLCRKEYVFSVPAVWSDAAKHATLKAAEMAGLTPVQLIKEPEAAALWTTKKLNAALNSGDVFVVCDAGGGTVDLVSYEVETTDPKLQVKEIVPGTGGMAGSLHLNKRFESAVKELVGEEQWSDLRSSKGFQLASSLFEKEIKKGFEGDSDDDGFDDDEFYVNFYPARLKDNPSRGLESNTWAMIKEDLMDIFNPVIDDILNLVEQQVERVKIKMGGPGPKYIFLVGGFGSNRYLMKRISNKFPDIEVLQPPDAWAAIAKGAALSRMSTEATETTVTSVSATRHYGTRVCGRYDPIRDLGRPFHESLDDEIMIWYIHRGDELSKDTRIPFSLQSNFTQYEYDTGNLWLGCKLIESQEEPAPRYPSEHETFRTNCALVCDVSKVPKNLFIQKINKYGQTYYTLKLKLIMTLEGALMKFSLEIDGVMYGSVEANYSP